ncbi:MAG: GNAT family N-acyltransferase [Nitrolancea sp.]
MRGPHTDHDSDVAQLSRLDALASRALDALAPLSFTVARTPLENDAVLRMRYECVTEMGWAKPEDYPDGRERDEHDDGATFIVAREDGSIIASARLVPAIPGELLPAEREFYAVAPPPGRPVEIGRVIIPRRYRSGRSHLLLAGLFARSWLIARELGYYRIVSMASASVIDLYHGLGVTARVLAAPKPSWGEERSLVELSATDSSLGLLARAAGVDARDLD